MSDLMRRRMQEQLDGLLSEEHSEELLDYLQRDAQAAEEYARLERVDALLARAPQMRAPGRLAATIMARLAQVVEREAEMREMPEEAQQALLMSLSLAIMSMLPVMTAATWLVLNAHSDPALLTRAMQRVIAFFVLIIDALVILLEEIESLVHERPELAAAAMTLLPSVLLALVDAMALTELSEDDPSSDE